MTAMKFLLADDHPMVRMGLKMMLNRIHRRAEIIEARDYIEARQVCSQHTGLSLILLDRVMPGMGGLEGLASLREQAPDTPIVVMSASEEPDHVWESLQNGAQGYIPKSSSEEIMRGALQLVLSGGTYLPPTLLRNSRAEPLNDSSKTWAFDVPSVSQSSELTKRQREVLALLVKGKSNKQIAGTLGIAEATVHTHVNAIFRILNVNNRTQAVHVVSKLDLSSTTREDTV